MSFMEGNLMKYRKAVLLLAAIPLLAIPLTAGMTSGTRDPSASSGRI
jgi:hypothetical protein